MGFKKAAKEFLIGTTLAGVLFYGCTNMHIAYDYNKNQKPVLEENGGILNALEYRTYSVNIDDKEKEFTLIGETHMYNKTEHDLAATLVDKHTTFANECGYGEDVFGEMSKSTLAYGVALSLSLQPNFFYFTLASGRNYSSASDIAYDNGEPVLSLENNNETFANIRPSLKVVLLAGGIMSAVVSPLEYYSSKTEEPFDPSKYVRKSDFTNDMVVIRDEKMANSIVSILEDDEVDDLLANIGRGHINGVHEHLVEKLDLKMIECFNCSIKEYTAAKAALGKSSQ